MAKKIKEYNRIPDKMKKIIKPLNNLSGSEWTQLSKSVNVYGGSIAQKRKDHGAAFPLELAKHYIKIYTNEHDTVFDPFMGVGTTADACSLLNRNCVGFELNPDYFSHATQGIDPVDSKGNLIYDINKQIYNDNCLNLDNYLQGECIDLTVTSPPYADLLHKVAHSFAGYSYDKNIYNDQGRDLAKPYSENEEDFGNLSFEEYQHKITELMGKIYSVTNEGGYNVWVVKDYRDVENHIPYVNLHSKIIDAAIRSNWILVDVVIWDQSAQRKLVKLGGIKSRRFYFNIGHSFILVFRKNIKGEKFTNE
ncbi:site-specific DNA-methyltransferase [Paenibacillus sp. CAA11]|uniref:site-specific DNA-methyltransferase n=1 Tax=Paenibacillus sp. CAA11 TaxID=1532905 RepID=UPI000D33FC26|nr:site-specific DNA-methyltransferase [Paenibacillus sp. CAA11]AWB43429.1 site-specific DNA-methyltransferase [Paenibacillus sp. CAA11]